MYIKLLLSVLFIVTFHVNIALSSKDTSALEDLPQRHHRTIKLDERQQIKAAKLTQNYKVGFIFPMIMRFKQSRRGMLSPFHKRTLIITYTI